MSTKGKTVEHGVTQGEVLPGAYTLDTIIRVDGLSSVDTTPHVQ